MTEARRKYGKVAGKDDTVLYSYFRSSSAWRVRLGNNGFLRNSLKWTLACSNFDVNSARTEGDRIPVQASPFIERRAGEVYVANMLSFIVKLMQ